MGFGDRVSDPAGNGFVPAFALAFYVFGCVLLVFTDATLAARHLQSAVDAAPLTPKARALLGR
jgi:hypothetical protein